MTTDNKDSAEITATRVRVQEAYTVGMKNAKGGFMRESDWRDFLKARADLERLVNDATTTPHL